jgi:hypothetical protein
MYLNPEFTQILFWMGLYEGHLKHVFVRFYYSFAEFCWKLKIIYFLHPLILLGY